MDINVLFRLFRFIGCDDEMMLNLEKENLKP
jgi:hypothetical protein